MAVEVDAKISRWTCPRFLVHIEENKIGTYFCSVSTWNDGNYVGRSSISPVKWSLEFVHGTICKKCLEAQIFRGNITEKRRLKIDQKWFKNDN